MLSCPDPLYRWCDPRRSPLAAAFVVTIRDFVESPSLRLLDAGSFILFALLALADAVEVGAVTKVNGGEVMRVVEHVQPIHEPLGWIAFLACSSRMRARQRRCATNDMRFGLHE